MSLKRKMHSDGNDGFETNAQVILLDIEGTTTSISFVKEVLFTYVTKSVLSYLESNYDEDETKQDIDALRAQVAQDKESGIAGVIEIKAADSKKEDVISTTVANVKWQMSADRKTTALKQLQGHIWKSAYEQGKVRGHVYDDVEDCFKKWKAAGKTLCIYSSGSVAAQQLLFSYSEAGDLTQYLTDYFDTKVGGKREASSYVKIAELIKVNPNAILFLTDIKEEADAARTAGMATCILVRDGLIDENDTKDHPKVQNFNQITLSDVVVGGADSLAAKIPKLPDSVELNGASDDKAK